MKALAHMHSSIWAYAPVRYLDSKLCKALYCAMSIEQHVRPFMRAP